MLGQIIELAHKISAERKTDVFIDYHGHTKGLNVRVFADGWVRDKDAVCDKTFYLDNDNCSSALSEVLEFLQSIYDNEPLNLEVGQCCLCKRKLYTSDASLEIKGGKVCTTCADELEEAITTHGWGL